MELSRQFFLDMSQAPNHTVQFQSETRNVVFNVTVRENGPGGRNVVNNTGMGGTNTGTGALGTGHSTAPQYT